MLVQRTREVLTAPHPTLAIWATVVLLSAGTLPSLQKVTPQDVVSNLITYDALVLSFCVAAVALVIALPNERFARFLASSAEDKSTSPYQDLVFVFAWTAAVHWGALLFLLVIQLFGLKRQMFPLPTDWDLWSCLLIGFYFLQIYALMQFFATIRTVWQVGDLYGQFLKSPLNKPTNAREQSQSRAG